MKRNKSADKIKLGLFKKYFQSSHTNGSTNTTKNLFWLFQLFIKSHREQEDERQAIRTSHEHFTAQMHISLSLPTPAPSTHTRAIILCFLQLSVSAVCKTLCKLKPTLYIKVANRKLRACKVSVFERLIKGSDDKNPTQLHSCCHFVTNVTRLNNRQNKRETT